MHEGYDDSDLNEEDRLLQRTVLKNLISKGEQIVRIRRDSIYI